MVEIRTVSHMDKRESLVDLFRISFSQDMSAEHWDWKCRKNPLVFANAEIIVALEAGKIVV